MEATDAVNVPIAAPDDVVRARQAGRATAARLGFGLADQTRLATAISEIARNALHYGGGGRCEICVAQEDGQRAITVIVTDHGPGIPEIDKAMSPGFSTGNSLGMGLPGAARLVDRLHVESRPGLTQVRLEMRRKVR